MKHFTYFLIVAGLIVFFGGQVFYVHAAGQEETSSHKTPVLSQLPREVQKGSIKVPEAARDEHEEDLIRLANISFAEVAGIAHAVAPGRIVEAKLDEENNYLIWEVTIIGTQGHKVELKIDAGSGKLLATQVDENEDNNEDEGTPQRRLDTYLQKLP